MSDFRVFATAVAERFKKLSNDELYVTVDGDDLWAAYLAAFPPGTNEIYRERPWHDCNACRNFVRNAGNVVAIIDGVKCSVWSNLGRLPEPYATVADRMDEYVTEGRAIKSLFRTDQNQYGMASNRSLEDDGTVTTWHHFVAHIKNNSKHHIATPDRAKGEYAARVQVFKRGLDEITESTIDTVLELIGANALYRGDEKIGLLAQFRQHLTTYRSRAKTVESADAYVWANASSHSATLRNDVIGTLLIDIAEGRDVDYAVSAYEKKVAPTNYKRPSAIITPRMVEAAMSELDGLGLRSAIARRHATIEDVSINNVLWVDNDVRSRMRDSIADALMAEANGNIAVRIDQSVDSRSEARRVSVDDFMAKALPQARKIEVFVRSSNAGNFVTVTAPVHADAERLFKWDNGFAWSYGGNVTDSIKERVKRAGGNVTNAALRVSLSWSNIDDLDLHCEAPIYGKIYFGARHDILDVDMNNGFTKLVTDPVENMSWTRDRLFDGQYRFAVHQYNQRTTSDTGFDIEVENNGRILTYHFAPPVRTQQIVPLFEFRIDDGRITNFANKHKDLIEGSASRQHWGVQTETFVAVDTLMTSPNHWDDNAVGNKHWFFLLDGCRTDEPARGIYNEFLSSKLDKHRKVFERLGDKSKVPTSDRQLSGVGFSAGRGDSVLVRVTGAKRTALFDVQF